MWIIFVLITVAFTYSFLLTDQCPNICKNAQLPALELVIILFYCTFILDNVFRITMNKLFVKEAVDSLILLNIQMNVKLIRRRKNAICVR